MTGRSRGSCDSIRRRTARRTNDPWIRSWPSARSSSAIALIVAILLQARGTGLSGTFGGDSAVYRSRRGVERRLWQFTIVAARPVRPLLAGLVRLRRPSPDRAPPAATSPRRPIRTESHDPDRYAPWSGPSSCCSRSSRASSASPRSTATTATPLADRPRRHASARAYREGVARAPGLDQPADGAHPGRPRPRRPRLLRPRAQRPGRHDRAGPRRALVRRRDRQDLDLRPPRRRALARRRAGHRGRRRRSRSRPSRTRPTRARRPVVERGRRSRPSTPRDGRVHPRRRRSAASSQAATQPIAPAHLLGDVPVATSAGPPVRRGSPSGPVRSRSPSLDDDARRARPGRRPSSRRPPASADPSARRDRLAHDRPSDRPRRRGRRPTSPGSTSASTTTPTSSSRRYRAGDLDAAVRPAARDGRATSRRMPDSRLLRYPGSTLTAVLAQPPPGPPRVPRSEGAARPCSGRSTAPRSSTRVYADAAVVAPDPVPPTSALFDPAADPLVPFDPGRGEEGAQGRRLDPEGRRLAPARRQGPARDRGRSARTGPPTRSPTPSRPRWSEDWTALGLDVTHEAAAPGGVRDGAALQRDVHRRRRGRHHRPRPGPLPAAGSSQTRTGGSNVPGVQDPALDELLVAARAPGTQARARGGVFGAREGARGPVDTCSRSPSRTRSWWSATRSRDPPSAAGRRPG